MKVNENTALFSLLKTKYGGDGTTTFALPDLRGRVAMHRDDTYPVGRNGGSEKVGLTGPQMPSHKHTVFASTSNAGDNNGPEGGVWGASANEFAWAPAPANLTMNAASIAMTGAGTPHENRIPVLALSYIIALQGVFPQRT